MSPKSQNLNFHEDLRTREYAPVPDDRTFGFTLAAVLGIIGTLRFFISGGLFAFVFIALGLCILGLTFKKPEWIAAIKNQFLKLAPKISAVFTPVLMAFVFAVCFIPGALILRAMHKDPLERKPDPFRLSYWTKREEHTLPDPMKYQF